MDKQTLSNYGWLVIVTLVLAIMLALATPFGSYVGDAVVSVANGMASTNEDATNEENITQESVEWSVKTDHGIDYNTFKYYNSIEDAINDVNSNDYSNGSNKLKGNSVVVSAPDGKIPVVRLVRDANTKGDITVDKDLIFDLNAHTLTLNKKVNLFNINTPISFSVISSSLTGTIKSFNAATEIFINDTPAKLTIKNVDFFKNNEDDDVSFIIQFINWTKETGNIMGEVKIQDSKFYADGNASATVLIHNSNINIENSEFHKKADEVYYGLNASFVLNSVAKINNSIFKTNLVETDFDERTNIGVVNGTRSKNLQFNNCSFEINYDATTTSSNNNNDIACFALSGISNLSLDNCNVSVNAINCDDVTIFGRYLPNGSYPLTDSITKNISVCSSIINISAEQNIFNFSNVEVLSCDIANAEFKNSDINVNTKSMHRIRCFKVYKGENINSPSNFVMDNCKVNMICDSTPAMFYCTDNIHTHISNSVLTAKQLFYIDNTCKLFLGANNTYNTEIKFANQTTQNNTIETRDKY